MFEKDGGLFLETWVVNRRNNFGFYLDDVQVPEDKLIESILEHFKKLDCVCVEKAYDAIYECK